MTIYWERCDFCGQHRPVRKCSIVPDISVDIHCCISCPMWMDKCKTPAWKIEAPLTTSTTRRRALSSEEKERLLKELTSLLKEGQQ